MDPQLEIQVEGHLDSRWVDWFDGMTLTPQPDGTTILSGPLTDQAALQGLLRRIGDIGLTLISVNRIIPSAS